MFDDIKGRTSNRRLHALEPPSPPVDRSDPLDPGHGLPPHQPGMSMEYVYLISSIANSGFDIQHMAWLRLTIRGRRLLYCTILGERIEQMLLHSCSTYSIDGTRL